MENFTPVSLVKKRPEELRRIPWEELLQMRRMAEGNQELQDLLSAYEHGAWAKEAVKDNPAMFIPISLAIPAYNVYKQVTGSGRSNPSLKQVTEGYRGVYEGLKEAIIPSANASEYGNRQDGSQKGKGFLGELKRPGGGVSTELTIGTNVGGKDLDIPLLVPTLSKEEVDALLSVPDNKKPWDVLPNFREIERKAVEHAKMRMKAGKSVYAD